MRLTELEPRFLRHVVEDGRTIMQHVDRIEDAHGIWFLCPKCFVSNGGRVGTHGVICWSRSRGTPEDARPRPGRWKIDGTGFDDLTLNADPPATARSVKLEGGCAWHGHITNGEVTS